jgi:hypothetical protein
MYDTQSAPHFSEGDGKAIFISFKGSALTIIHASSNLVAKKAAIKALPVPGIMGLVQQGLKALESSLDAFENALMASEPVSRNFTLSIWWYSDATVYRMMSRVK